MKSHFTRILLLSSFLIFSNTSTADTLYGRVVGVADGDTVTVLDATNTQWKIRLMGIDAPEKKQPFGNKSKEHLSSLVFNKQVSVEYSKQDKYGRTVGKILVDGTDSNLQQIKAGLAWHYKKYQKEQSVEDRTTYAQAEEQARTEKQGLWIDPDPTPPWDFRHGTGDASQMLKNKSDANCPCASGTTCTGPKGGVFCMTAGGSKKYR
jgi:endonuclease YncB( thermonuclease family)